MSTRDLASRRWLVGVVDDEPLMRRSLTRVLENAGYSIEAFASARAFLDRDRGDRMDCLVVDVNMPGLDGLALQSVLIDATFDIPIVMMSGQSERECAARALKAGAVAFLFKPFDAPTLLQVVRVAIDSRLRTALPG